MATVDAMRALGLLLALGALVLAAAGCGGGTETAEKAASTATETETAPPAETAKRPAAPPIEGVTLDGDRVSLADFRGKPVFVNVWSSW